MTALNKRAQLRKELSNPAIGSNHHLRQLALSLLDELEAAEKLAEVESRGADEVAACGIYWLKKFEAAEKRIAELGARAVNLPKRSVGEVMHMSGFSRDYAEGWCAGNDNAIHEIRAAGIGVKGE